MSGKFALIIGNTEYTDPGLAQLTAPGKDTEDFARVLKDHDIGAFDDVNILLNQPEPVVRGAIDEFFDQKKPDDLLVLYFSGHGVRDELGALFLAVKNTIRSRLRSTAVKSDYIRDVMDQSRSRRQVLILDCCNSGAFSQGTKAATGVSIGTASAFEGGYGRIILTASDSTQFAWEGDKVIGETDNSLFTHYLVEGLEGEADLDGDGRITVDELYDYVYEKVKLATPKQTPSKFSSKQQGEIVLRHSMRIEDMKPVPLPTPLLDSIENPFSDIRFGAVQQLTKLLNGKNLGLARSAQEALERIAENDDSRQVQRAAAQALESVREVAQETLQKSEEDRLAKLEVERIAAEERTAREQAERKAREDAGRAAAQKAEGERIAKAKLKEESLEKEKAERVAGQVIRREKEIPKPETETTTSFITNQQAILWIMVGWVLAGAVVGAIYWMGGEFSIPLGGAAYGGIGGFVTAITLRARNVLASGKNIYLVTLAWIIGGVIGWTVGDAITEAYGAGIGETIGLVIALAGTFSIEKLLSHWKDMLLLIFLWAISSAVGWSIGKTIQEAEGFVFSLYIGKAAGWALGWAFSGVVGGYVLGRQLLKDTSEFEIANSSQQSPSELTTFLLSWKGRMLLGGMVGTIVVFTAWLLEGFFTPASLIAVFTGSVAGLITYPHKLSIVLLTLGFMILGITEPDTPVTFIAIGVVAGLPLGALASRILYWLKVLK